METRNIKQSYGYKILYTLNLKKPSLGSIKLMNDIVNDLKNKLELFNEIQPMFELNPFYIEQTAIELSKLCLKIRDIILPQIMIGRIKTKESTYVYNKIIISCSHLLDDIQTWWNVQIPKSSLSDFLL